MQMPLKMAAAAGALVFLVLTVPPASAGQGMIWPLSGSTDPDADRISQPYGPRWIGNYDFHAGIDIPAPTGTPIKAVLPGTVVQVRHWDGETIGAGNAVLVAHEDGLFSSYLHLNTIGVEVGRELQQGEQLGTVGETGARSPHLHFGIMIDLPQPSVDERRSRNPLELLPHTPPQVLSPATLSSPHSITLQVPVRYMTIKSITLSGGGQERVLDYYAVVAKGFTPRKDQEQDGFFIETTRYTDGMMPLTLTLQPADFEIERVVVTDIHGQVILNQVIPEPTAVGAVLMGGLMLLRRPTAGRIGPIDYRGDAAS